MIVESILVFARSMVVVLAVILFQGCDSGTSMNQFGATTGGSATSESSEGEFLSRARSVELYDEELSADEYSAHDFFFDTNNTVARMWIVADVEEGPEAEIFFVTKAKYEEWVDHYESGAALQDFDFGSEYPALDNLLPGFESGEALLSNGIIVESGEYVVLIDKTDAGNIPADPSGDLTRFNFILMLEFRTADGTAEFRMISSKRVRVPVR